MTIANGLLIVVAAVNNAIDIKVVNKYDSNFNTNRMTKYKAKY